MLGVHLAPDGKNNLQFQKMKEKAKELAEFTRIGHICPNETWIALQTMAMKSIEYPLPALTLSEEECEKIMWILLQAFLPKLGINRYMKRDVVYGGKSQQGLGIKNLFISQGLTHVNDLIEHVWKNTITGHLIISSLENLRLELGCNIPILASDYDKYEDLILTESWIQHTWRFMSQYDMQVYDDTRQIPTAREFDEVIMDTFIEAGITGTRLYRANRCRIFLQALTLADITTGDGIFITKEAWSGERSRSTCRHNSFEWPEWGTPSKLEKTAWKEALQFVFCSRRERCLDQPLGAWTIGPGEKWQWYTHNHNNLLYRRREENWEIHQPIGRRTRQPRFHTNSAITHPPKENDIT